MYGSRSDKSSDNFKSRNVSFDYYDILGVGKDALKSDIKKSYHKQARKYHPDKVSDPGLEKKNTEKFQKIGEAYEVLSDDKKRKIYDQYGKEGLKDGFNGGGMNPFDMFSQFFKNGSGFSFNNFSQKKVKKSIPFSNSYSNHVVATQ